MKLSVAALMTWFAMTATAASLTETADQLYKQRRDPEKARAALGLYRSSFEKNSSDPEIAWRLSMASYFVGLRLTKESDKREALFREGRDAGRRALELKPECAPCHFWTAVNMALYGQEVGPFKMFFSLRTIQGHLNETLRLDATYAYGGAYRILGAIENKLPGILGGSDARAREYFEQAIKLVPGEPLNYLFLARLLLQDSDTRDEGLAVVRRGLVVPKPPADQLEAVEALENLKTLLPK